MRPALWFALLIALSGTADAIFEEQAGQVDWNKQNIGRILHAELAFRGRERVFVATSEGVVASLDTRDGSIAWRQVMEERDQVDALVLVPRPASVLTLSRQGRILRAWHALNGGLLWEKVVADSSAAHQPSVIVLPDVTGDGSSEVAVISGTKLQVLSAPSGKLVWAVTLPGSAESSAQSTSGQETAISIAVSEAGGLFLRTYDAKTGEEVAAKQLAPSTQQAVVGSGAAAALTSDGRLCGIKNEAASPVCTKLSTLLPESGSKVALGKFLDPITLPLLLEDSVVLVRIEDKIKVVASHSGFTAADAIDGSTVGLAGVSNDGTLRTLLIDLSSQSVTAEQQFESKLLPASGPPLRVRQILLGSRKVGEYGKPDSTLHRWLVVAEDDSLYFLERRQIVWQREEGLASITAAMFLDLPSSTIEGNAQQLETRATLMDRINAEILTFKSTIGFIQPEEREQLKQLTRRISTHLLPHRDANGFRKMIIALSSSGKLFALHSGDGRILWQLPLRGVGGNARLFLWRSSRDAQQAPEVLVLSSEDCTASYTVVNTHTGSVVEGGSIPGTLQQVIELPETMRDGSGEQRVLALVSEQNSVTTLPDSADARELLAKQPFHFWAHEKSSGVLAGYRLMPGAAAAEQLWSIAFAGPSDAILQIATKDPNEHVYSYAKVLGNRSLKLKYLNPNAIFVVTGPADGTPTSAISDPTLTVHLIDTFTGQILYRQSLQGAKGPANVVMSENWAVYGYYSAANARHELAVLEFYDAAARSLSIPSLLFGTQNSTMSPYAPSPIEVLHQSYFTAIGLKTIAVTATRRGISSKQLLLGTNANQVYLMDKRFVDPRRPRGTPTADEKAEMLPPYNEELLFAPQLFGSHKETIEGLRGIIASPANLESTTLALSYGLDLFFMRVQPSKTFDLLPDDFPYALLLLVTASLTIGAFVLKRMDASSSLKRKWL